jgi:Outer membrane protein beta-barrel domain
MKTTTLAVLALTLSFATAFAQSEERVLNSDPINVDGYLQEQRPVTDGELESIRGELTKQKMGTQLNKEKSKDLGKLSQQTEKLLESQDEYIDSKIESTKAIQEFNKKHEENQKKLRCILEESASAECDPYKNKYGRNKKEVVQEITSGQASPVVSQTEASSFGGGNFFETIKLLPYVGATNYNGKVEQLESELAGGIRLESNVNGRFSMGIGINMAQLKTNDFANGFNNNQYQGYQQYYGTAGREIQYRQMGLDLYGKFFITRGERFRPYIGAGLGYNRASMRYTQNNSMVNQNAYQFGSEEYNQSFASGSLSMGSEIMITRGFGLNLEIAYATGLGSSMTSQNAKNPFSSPDQGRLKDLGDEIINSNQLSIFAGAVVVF